MKVIRLLILVLIFCVNAQAQFLENFSDGNFDSNPHWSGDSLHFLIDFSLRLKSNGPPISSEIYLSTEYNSFRNKIWSFQSILDFSPSASNYAKFYLLSDNSNLTDTLNGYFVKIAGESGNVDGIDLYSQEGFTTTKLIDGIEGFAGKDSLNVKIRVERDYYGNWKVFADTGSNFIFQGEVFDSTHTHSSHIGVNCKHSSTRFDKFYFDDISIVNGPLNLLEAQAESQTKIKLTFSSALDSLSALNTQNYFINNGIGNPLTVNWLKALPNIIYLNLSDSLLPGEFLIQVNSLFDNEQNPLSNDSLTFKFLFEPQYHDLLFNEIMFDPEPIVLLPKSEYVELYNASEQDFQLSEIKYSDFNSTISLPEFLVRSKSYLILCPIEDTLLFKSFGNTLGIENWLSLNNSGDVLSLYNKEGELIDAINYDPSFYRNSNKADGGWSIERIDPNEFCSYENNWRASESQTGGSPGLINSVYNSIPDTVGPILLDVKVLSPSSLELTFDDKLDFIKSKIAAIHSNSNINAVVNKVLNNQLEISLSIHLDSGKIHQFFIDSLFDCHTNKNTNISFEIGIGRAPSKFDLIITEVMSDPSPSQGLPEVEYLELYNASTSILDLGTTKLTNSRDSVFLYGISLFPNEYVCVCSNSNVELLRNENRNIAGLSPWPSLKNEADNLSLIHNNHVISFLDYQNSWFKDISKKEGGWSLEMIDLRNTCEEAGNWDASINSLGGTPGEKNSLQFDNLDFKSPKVTSIHIESPANVSIYWDEYIDAELSKNYSIKIDPFIEVKDLDFISDFSKTISLELKKEIEKNREYTISLKDFKDCMGNSNENNIHNFIIPNLPSPNSIIINEVLYDPYSGGVEFLEILNTSPSFLELKNCQIGVKGINSEEFQFNPISNQNLVLPPFELMLITEDSSAVIDFYPKYDQKKFFQINQLPSLPNDGATIIIQDSSANILDQIQYSDQMHYELLNQTKGVSLERVSPTLKSVYSENWKSASENHHFASPGLVNSQYTEINTETNVIEILPRLFSPDGDGYKDLLSITINDTQNNQSALIQIYNSKGQLVKDIAYNSNLGVNNSFLWDGFDNQGNKSPIGNYIVLLEIYDTRGMTKKHKEVISIGGQI